MKVFLGNDTSRWHCGSAAVMENLRAALHKHELVKSPAGADAVIVNGEGTMHHDNGAKWLKLLAQAKQDGKQAHLLNSVFQGNLAGVSILSQLDVFHVREPLSAKEARHLDGSPNVFVDASTLTFLDTGKVLKPLPTITHGAATFYSAITLRSDLPVRGLSPTVHFRDVVATLAHSDTVYITGEHHGVIAAILARRPFVAIPSNTWKIEGLLEWFRIESGLQIPIVKTPGDIDKAIHFARENYGIFIDFHLWLRSKAYKLKYELEDLYE